MTGPFAMLAETLVRNGYSPVPLRPGTKRPLFDAWNRLRSMALTANEIAAIARRQPAAGLGVAGGFNGLVPIDCDTDDAEIIDAVTGALPMPSVAKAGRHGWTAFYRDPSGTITARKLRSPDRMLVEVLVTGQSVLPPTIHPETGRPYAWLTSATLCDTPVDRLTSIDPDHLANLELGLAPWLPARRFEPPNQNGQPLPTGDRRLRSYARAVLAGEVRMLRTKPKNGGRNTQLFLAACKLGKYVHHKVMAPAEVESALLKACEANGLLHEDGLKQCQATLASGFNKAQHDRLPSLGAR